MSSQFPDRLARKFPSAFAGLDFERFATVLSSKGIRTRRAVLPIETALQQASQSRRQTGYVTCRCHHCGRVIQRLLRFDQKLWPQVSYNRFRDSPRRGITFETPERAAELNRFAGRLSRRSRGESNPCAIRLPQAVKHSSLQGATRMHAIIFRRVNLAQFARYSGDLVVGPWL